MNILNMLKKVFLLCEVVIKTLQCTITGTSLKCLTFSLKRCWSGQYSLSRKYGMCYQTQASNFMALNLQTYDSTLLLTSPNENAQDWYLTDWSVCMWESQNLPFSPTNSTLIIHGQAYRFMPVPIHKNWKRLTIFLWKSQILSLNKIRVIL